MEKRELKIGGIYKHFKGSEYIVLALAKDSETLEDIVVYVTLYNKTDAITHIWTRKLEDFMGTKEVDGKVVNRFELIGNR